jgi:hypothetical protein
VPGPEGGSSIAENAFHTNEELHPDAGGNRPPRVALGVEYLLWWLKPGSIPPLVTAGAATDPIPGALGQPGTSVLLGDRIAVGGASGVRVSGTYWILDPELLSIEGNYFALETRSAHFNFASNGAGVLARPFFNPSANGGVGGEDADVFSFPSKEAGSLTVTDSSRLWGAEGNLRLSPPGLGPTGPHCSILGGFRYLALDEQLGADETVIDLPVGQSRNQNIFRTDNIGTTNRFNGGQVGIGVGFSAWRMSLDLQAKVAVGQLVETANLSGNTRITDQGTGAVLAAANDRAFLVQPSNVGSLSFTRVAIVPEADLTWVVDFNDRVHLVVGYTFLYWNHVARPGDQIDRVINIQPVPLAGAAALRPASGARPLFTSINDSSFWAQGINVGLELRF